MINDSESHELVQIEMAARGCISGSLSEWPHLIAALRRRGFPVNKHNTTEHAVEMCKSYLGWDAYPTVIGVQASRPNENKPQTREEADEATDKSGGWT